MPTGDQQPGFRLDRLEVLNWGTFHRRVWTFTPQGENGLLTGEIGSGKSTLVDAVTTLLVPAHRISYNKAAGAETRERTLRSYVLGYYKAERNETTGASRPVALRGADSHSVILGVFRNHASDMEVSLAQVFWTRDGVAAPPERFYVTAERSLSIVVDLADFGDTVAALRKRLRATGARVHDHFPEYAAEYRRLLGVESEQAMELFHQTVSMKAVGNLNDFVRGHMLEPFDAKDWVKRLVGHFDDLTTAHDAVVAARAQLADLAPLLEDCDAYDRLAAEIGRLDSERAALRYFCADRKRALLEREVADLNAAIVGREGELRRVRAEIEALDERNRALDLERAGRGGDRIGELERQIRDGERTLVERQHRAARFGELLAAAELGAVEHAEQFPTRRREIATAAAQADLLLADLQNHLTDVAVEQKAAQTEAAKLNAELISLRSRPSNIPAERLGLRRRLCADVGIPEDMLPFAGELIQVRQEHAAWEGAAERLLRGFGLSLLVPDEHYRVVSGWIDLHHLGARLVYYRVPRAVPPEPLPAEGQLFWRLEIQQGPHYAWLERELARRAGYDCAETMDEFRRAARAITRAGQINHGRGRHEKDDRQRIGDRTWYVLGWRNEQKIAALVEQAGKAQQRLNDLADEQKRTRQRLEAAQARGKTLAKLAEFSDYSELDWPDTVRRVEAWVVEKRRIEESSSELSRVTAEIATNKDEMANRERARDDVTETIGRLRNAVETAGREFDRAREVLAEPDADAARRHFDRLAELVDPGAMATPGGCDRAGVDATATLGRTITQRTGQQTAAANRAIARMSQFRQRHPVASAELDASMAGADGYRELHRRLVSDDLPRFEERFKTYLNTNTIRDIAGFQAQLNKQVELIKERIATINRSLHAIDYNPSRYIRLELHPTPNVEIRDFRAQVRACTDSSVSGAETDQYAEQKFLQVKQIIERLRGREGQTQADAAWAQRVTDVRNWFSFSASERWREDDAEHETYTDSGGKSGGQKEKLAYTILAASLTYQFRLDSEVTRSRAFRFVVIDEAFGRGSETSARFALELFQRLGLQLMIVTPLQKIHVIEPYVAAVGYVDNTEEGDCSRLQNLTIEEYRRLRVTRELSRTGQ
jgi:uncharacterized protein YPO0396